MQGQGGGGAGWHEAGSGAGLPGTPGGSPLGGDPRRAPTAISTPEAPAAAARGLRVLWGPLTGPRAPSPGSATDCGHRDACGRERRGPRGGAPGGGDGSWRGGCDRRPRASHSPCDEETRPRRGERGPRARGPPRPSTRVSGPAGNTPREPPGLRTSSAGRPFTFAYGDFRHVYFQRPPLSLGLRVINSVCLQWSPRGFSIRM